MPTAAFLAQTSPLECNKSNCRKKISLQDLDEIFPEREDFMRACKKSLQIYLKNHASVHDQLFCPTQTCDGLIKRSRGYQTCLICGHEVCASCALIDDDLHRGRTCAERVVVHKMGDFFPNLFQAAEKFARDNWATATPPIIRIDYNTALVDQCLSLTRFQKGVQSLGHSLPPDMGRGFFAFHGTAATSIKPICMNGFDPRRRAGQACGVGEYFGVTAAVSHGYCRPTNPQGPYSMIIAFLLNCPQLSSRPGFCHVMNNPLDWSYSLNLPVVVVSYGTQGTCQSPLNP
jgi:Poly(ADP-ribose) polymerase catalytic domain